MIIRYSTLTTKNLNHFTFINEKTTILTFKERHAKYLKQKYYTIKLVVLKIVSMMYTKYGIIVEYRRSYIVAAFMLRTGGTTTNRHTDEDML